MPRPPCVHATSPTLRKLVAGYAAFPQMAGRDCRMPLLMFSLALRTTKTTPGLIATGDYPPSLCSPWRAAVDKRIQARKKRIAEDQINEEYDAAQEKRCLEARMRLSILQEQSAIYRDENGGFHVKWAQDTYQGKREYLDDTQRNTEISLTNRIISIHCKKPHDEEEQKIARNKMIKLEYCAARRSELAKLLLPGKRASRQKIKEKRKAVKNYCNE